MTNTNSPQISVYITNHNYGRYVEQAIKSVLVQSFKDFELIIIDDGSTDNSPEILARYIGHDCVQVIFQESKGLNRSNNIALNLARGRYILRLDADDFLDSNALLVLHNALERDGNLAMAFPDYFLVDAAGEVIAVERRNDFSAKDVLYDRPAHGACTMFRRDVLARVGGYTEDYTCQDGVDIWLKIIANYPVINVPTPLFYYRQHGNNLTGNKKRILETRNQIFQDHGKERSKNTTAVLVIPVRGREISPDDNALLKINGTTALDRLIETGTVANSAVRIVVTSSDPDVKTHVLSEYDREEVVFIPRSQDLSLKNTRLENSLLLVLERLEEENLKPGCIIALSTEYPYISAGSIDAAANCFALFSSEKVISTVRSRDAMYQHNGASLAPIGENDKFMRLEREQVFVHKGGIIAYQVEALRNNSFRDPSAVTSFVEVDEISAQSVHTELGVVSAEFIAELADQRNLVTHPSKGKK